MSKSANYIEGGANDIHPVGPQLVKGEKFDGDMVRREKSDEEFNADIALAISQRKEKLNDKTIDLALKMLDAQESLEWSCSHIKDEWMQWMAGADKRLKEIRMQRMAFDTEAKHLLTQAADVRKFFLDEKHVEEVTRLREFIELCERLEALKKRGTLDAITDVMLKLV